MNRRSYLISVWVLLNLIPISSYGKTKMIFRYDDFTLKPSDVSDSVLSVFKRNKLPLCLGIIPFDSAGVLINQLTPMELDLLKSGIKSGELEVALHGYNHENHIAQSNFIRNHYSEFETARFETQLSGIIRGKRALDSLLQVNIEIFVPPFNTYDNNTVKALYETGFKIISGSLSGPSMWNSIKYMPSTLEDFSELNNVMTGNNTDNAVIILYFHPYSFREGLSQFSKDISKLITFSQLDSILKWIQTQDVSFFTFSGLSEFDGFDKASYRVNSNKFNLFRKVLVKMKRYNYGVYQGKEPFKIKAGFIAGNIIIHFLAFVFIYFVSNLLIKVLKPRLTNFLIIFAIFFIPLVIYLSYIRYDSSLPIILVFLFVNLCALTLALFRNYSNRLQSTKS